MNCELEMACPENESRVWPKIIGNSQVAPTDSVRDTYRECDELCRIINASVKTTKTRKQRR